MEHFLISFFFDINRLLSSNSHHMPVRLKDSPISQRTRMQHAEWLGNTTTLIIITENDIYLRQSPSDEKDIRLTHTGVPGLIYNGITDWLYQGKHLSQSSSLLSLPGTHSLQIEFPQLSSSSSCFPLFIHLFAEEIFKSQKALWSSNDGSMFLYATFNDTNVGQVNVAHYFMFMALALTRSLFVVIFLFVFFPFTDDVPLVLFDNPHTVW